MATTDDTRAEEAKAAPALIPERDPFDELSDALSDLHDAVDYSFMREDDYRPLPASDKALLRAAALMRQAISYLRTATERETPRYDLWDLARQTTQEVRS